MTRNRLVLRIAAAVVLSAAVLGVTAYLRGWQQLGLAPWGVAVFAIPFIADSIRKFRAQREAEPKP